MLKIPKTISQVVPSQLPEFVRDDYEKFVQFLTEYYKWFEKNGFTVFSTRILAGSPNTVKLTNKASNVINAYQGMSVVCLNGPSKGQTRTIESYDPSTNIVTVYPPWNPGFVPLPNTSVAIRDNVSPDKLLQYRDIDQTLDQFLPLFRNEFLGQIPNDLLADPHQLLKNIKSFYQSRGTENSFKFLFRIIFNEEIQLFYPKTDMLRVDYATWIVDPFMRVTTTENTFDWTSRRITGQLSGATANVETVTQSYKHGTLVTDLYLSNINGIFGNPEGGPEDIFISYAFTPPPQTDLGALSDLLQSSTIFKYETPYYVLQNLNIANQGTNYEVNDQITLTQPDELENASGFVSSIYQTFYTGRCPTPPTATYLEPYWGPADQVTNDPTGQTDGVCIPGLYYFGDVTT